MISKFFSIALIAFFAQSSYAGVQDLKSGFIYTTQNIDSCGLLVKAFNSDHVISLQWVNNPTSGFACSGMETESYKCQGSRCISLKAVNTFENKSQYRYFIISETGNFYLNQIFCTADANGFAVKCENPDSGPLYFAATAYQKFEKPTLFSAQTFYIPGNEFAPAKDRNSAIAKAKAQAVFNCSQFWSTCTRDPNLDQFSPTFDSKGEFVTIFVRGN